MTTETPQDETAPNLTPGPQDRGGQGGMATREQQARERGEDPRPLAGEEQVTSSRTALEG